MLQVHGLDVLSVFDLATGDVVQLNNLGDDAEVLVRGELDGDGVKAPAGGAYYGGDLSRLSVPFLGAAEYEILRQWQREGRMLRFAGAGPAGALLWYEDTLIQVVPETVKGKSGGARGYRLMAERRGHGSHRIWLDEDLLAGPVGPLVSRQFELGAGWAAQSCFPGETDPEFGWVTFADGGGAGASVAVAQRIVFPVAGVRVTGSVSQNGADPLSIPKPNTEINATAFGGGAALAGGYSDLTLPSHPARVSASIVTPPGTWSLMWIPLYTAAAFAGEITLLRPALRLGTSTEPGAVAV